MELIGTRDATHYPVTIAVVAAERMLLRVSCRGGIPAATVAARLVRAFEALTSAHDTPADRLDVLPREERRHLLARAEGPTRALAGALSIPGRFAEQVARTPDAPAVESDGEVLTYGRLDAASDALAGRLREAGVRPGDTVALPLPRSVTMVVAQLAVLKAGGCCLPLDPGAPTGRLAALVGAADAKVAVAERDVQLPAGTQVLGTTGDPESTAPPPPSVHPEYAAYVMYTSGSTGSPRGSSPRIEPSWSWRPTAVSRAARTSACCCTARTPSTPRPTRPGFRCSTAARSCSRRPDPSHPIC